MVKSHGSARTPGVPVGPDEPWTPAGGATTDGAPQAPARTADVAAAPAGPAPVCATSVLEQLPDAVLVLGRGDGEWEVAFANDAAVELCGFERTQLLSGLAEPRHVLGLDADGARAVAAALEQGRPASLRVAAQRADGTGYWAGIALAPLEDATGQRWSAVVRDVSAQVASAQLERVRLDAERRARVALSLVARVSDLLQEVDSGDVLRAIADMLTRQVVAWSGFYVPGRTLREVDGIEDDPPPARPAGRRGAQRHDEDQVLDLVLAAAMRTLRLDPDRPAPQGTLTAELLELVTPHLAERPDALREVLVFPVLGRQRTLALLVALPRRASAVVVDDLTDGNREVQGFHEEVQTVLELTARRVGMAMDNAQLYAREHVLAETLQRAMLPEQDDVAGLDVWTYYAPNAEHAQVGGDWYDVVNLRASTVAVVIGDVVGHDVEAAAAMGQLRSVVRALAAELVDPGTVLGRVDGLVTGMRIPRSASLVYATLTPLEEGAWDFAYSRAGHLPPLRVRGGEVSVLDGAGGTLVGFSTGERGTARTLVLPGDVLVLYTDGLIERRDRPMRAGLEALKELAGQVHAPDAAGVGEELLWLADAPEDDVAMVVIRVPGGPEGEVDGAAPRQRRWQLPMDASSIGRARHAVRRTCRAWGMQEVAAAELVISELMANAVMHGWGRIGLRLQDTGDGLRIEVEDANPAPPITRERSASRVGGFGMHIVDRLADWGWRPTPTGKVVWARLRSQPRSTGEQPLGSSAEPDHDGAPQGGSD
ncbi:ATP-binding SpoIIE family protein phosphatase [Georgenia ruanii]|nr:SpoIIE family protein phosphatase [Georgenia ruanii]MPV89022.1 SpoIIE family protein phosphatase [Georgenia ruanii]